MIVQNSKDCFKLFSQIGNDPPFTYDQLPLGVRERMTIDGGVIEPAFPSGYGILNPNPLDGTISVHNSYFRGALVNRIECGKPAHFEKMAAVGFPIERQLLGYKRHVLDSGFGGVPVGFAFGLAQVYSENKIVPSKVQINIKAKSDFYTPEKFFLRNGALWLMGKHTGETDISYIGKVKLGFDLIENDLFSFSYEGIEEKELQMGNPFFADVRAITGVLEETAYEAALYLHNKCGARFSMAVSWSHLLKRSLDIDMYKGDPPASLNQPFHDSLLGLKPVVFPEKKITVNGFLKPNIPTYPSMVVVPKVSGPACIKSILTLSYLGYTVVVPSNSFDPEQYCDGLELMVGYEAIRSKKVPDWVFNGAKTVPERAQFLENFVTKYEKSNLEARRNFEKQAYLCPVKIAESYGDIVGSVSL